MPPEVERHAERVSNEKLEGKSAKREQSTSSRVADRNGHREKLDMASTKRKRRRENAKGIPNDGGTKTIALADPLNK